VTPRAGRHALSGCRDGVLLVRLAAPPVDGAANAALVDLLADTLDVPRRDSDIVSGLRARAKRVLVRGRRALELDARLARVLNSAGGTGTL
jgi:uncharacterized protein